MSKAPEAEAIADWLLADHRELIRASLDAADAVTCGLPNRKTPERDHIVAPLRAELVARGLMERYAALLAHLQRVYLEDSRPAVVPAPPYVVITSSGPVLRLTLDSERIVITLELFEIERGETVYYRKRDVPLADVPRVSVR